jgi:hypothetical protein
VKKPFNIQGTFAPQVQKCHGTKQAHATLLINKSFPNTPRTRSEASLFGGSHITKQNKTKQDKLPSFINSCHVSILNSNTSFIPPIYQEKISLGANTSLVLGKETPPPFPSPPISANSTTLV